MPEGRGQRSGKAGSPTESATDALAREAFIALYLGADRLAAEVEQLCRAEQLAMSHYTVLWFLSRRSGNQGVPMGAVIDGHINRASDATRLADKLESLGLIERLASPSDRRVVLVRLTTAGRRTCTRLTAAIQALHRRQWSNLTQAELRDLLRLLAKAADDGQTMAKLRALTAGGG